MIFDAVASCQLESLSLEPFRSHMRQNGTGTPMEVPEKPTEASTLPEKMHIFSSMTEKQMIKDALNKTNQNRTRAAKLLGISRRTLQNKIKEYGL
jgi:DNA-binding NtrC family response regulator